MELKTMRVERLDKGVCLVTIDNPPANTLSGDLQEDLYKLTSELGTDPEVRAVVFHSAHPKIFIAGADVGQVGKTSSGPVDYLEGVRQMQEALNKLESLPKPTIAAINGHALGGGCEFVLACDFRIMSKGTIGLTEVSLGLIPGAGGTQRLTKLLGKAKATELMLLGKRLNAEEAEKVGLIYRAVSEDTLLTEALALAEQLAEGAVGAISLLKTCIQAAELPLDDGLRIERESFVKTFATGEPAEGIKAFFEKRKPQFNRIGSLQD